MRTLLAFAVLTGAITCFAAAGQEVENAEKAWAAAVTANDYAAIDRLLGDGLIYGHSTGLVETKSQYIAALRSGQQKYDQIRHESMNVKTYGNAAVVSSRVRMTGSTKGKPFDNQLIMMHVWVKNGGAWKLVGHQTARMP
ncbi:MAG: nuclear transport factor 2 family protein [Bryobacteraceae bacterium]|nr:nuclear transport factor 2 family protein [Bryobacterales bacterium]MEB2359836.1 nuclear transport factor 2 family protein [Bryobacterales bacterium]NUN00144.1 nuclear transport factor 2 family protein [Bryobacteraceae bacterium]